MFIMMMDYCMRLISLVVIVFSIFIVPLKSNNHSLQKKTPNETCYHFTASSFPYDDIKNDYRLFSTKTTYLTAREEIKKLFNSKWPTNIEQCSPIYMFFLNRHSIRYPKAKEITELNLKLHSFRNELLHSGKLTYKLFIYLATWKFRMTESDDNHVSYSGKLESACTAKFFYKYFPTLLDIDKTTFDVGISTKVRTEETADAFINSLIDEQIDHDSVADFNFKSQIKEKKFKKIKQDVLMSHRTCKGLIKSSGSKIPKSKEYKILAQSKSIRKMLDNFSQRFGLFYTISLDSLILLYKACSYETAIFGFSPWCHLFILPELKIIEYLLDVDEYHDAYEVEPHRKLACTVIDDLFVKLKQMIQQQSGSNATLYFSHENLLSKVFSYFELFKYFPKIDSDKSDGSFCIPENREWRSSLIVPFGTNFVTILYKCPDSKNPFKILTLVNEIPVVVRGCDNSFCDIDKFFEEFNSDKIECDLEQICKI